MSGQGAWIDRRRLANELMAVVRRKGIRLCPACENRFRMTVMELGMPLTKQQVRKDPPACEHRAQAAS
jgi:hypothetical protein